MDLFFLVKLFFCDAASSWLLDWQWKGVWEQFFSLILTHTHMLTIDDSYHSSHRNCEDDTENPTEWCTRKHHHEYEKRREVECLAHNVWYEEVVLYALDDEVECNYPKCHLPWYPETDDSCWYQCNKWSDIWDELHDTSDNRKCKLLVYLEFCYTQWCPDES